MAATKKFYNDREVQAIIFNMKEQKLLAKSVSTLKREEEYSMKLLDLDNSDVKISEKRLKKRVSKIKSYLKPKDIVVLKTLDVQGKLPADNSKLSQSAITIASAHRRLKLTRGGSSQEKSTARKEPNAEPEPTDHLSHRGQSGDVRNPNRTTSVYDATDDEPRVSFKSMRPKTSHCYHASPRARSRSQRPVTAEVARYTSHTVNELMSCEGLSESQTLLLRQGSCLSEGSLGTSLAKKRADEHRQGLLADEHVRQCALDNRRQLFLSRTVKWVRETPVVQNNEAAMKNALDKLRKNSRKGSTYVDIDDDERSEESTRLSPAEEYREKLMNAWKDLRKCRYLRVPDDELDLSGVTTLAKTQFGLFEVLKDTSKQTKGKPHMYAGTFGEDRRSKLRRQASSISVVT